MNASSRYWSRRRRAGRLSASDRQQAAIDPLEARRLFAISIASTSPYNGAQNVGVTSNVLVTFGSAMTASTLTSSKVTIRDPSGNLMAAAVSYNASARVLTVDPTAYFLASSGYYTLRVTGGANGVKASDGTTLAADYVASFTTGSPSFTQQTIFSGLNKPTNVEFSPDGRVYVAEQSGIIRMFDNLTDTVPTTVADFRTNVHSYWDRGLLGMALDPNFTTGKPYVYILYDYDSVIGGTAPTWGTVGGTDDAGGSSPTGTGAPISGRLSRFAVDANGIMTGSEQVLINDWNQQFPSHSIGDLKFGPDGYLYASAGDGANFNNVDYGQTSNGFGDPVNEGGALRAQDILSDSDPAGLDGSVIRIDPNTGAAAPGNPFASSVDTNKRKIIANGLRNPFRLTFKPGTKELFIADTGWNDWEEINRIPDATDAAEENFGWPAYEGVNPQPAYQSLNLPLLQKLYNTPGAVTSPWFTYSHTGTVVAGSGEPTGGSTPTGVAFYGGTSYPAAYQGAFFFCDFARQRTYVMYVGPNGQINQNSRQIFSAGTGPVELTTGPNGDLFAVNLYEGTITRYVFSGNTNKPPVAALAVDVTAGGSPLLVHFDASASSDPDGTVLSYAWDLDGDGNFNDSTAAKPSWSYSGTLDITARVKVTDAGGLTSTAAVVIHVGDRPPVPVITLPLTTTHWSVGDLVNFAGSATDPDEGTLAASRLSWDLNLIHANDIDPNSTHTHHITGFAGVSSGSFAAPDHEYPSWLVLSLTATDARGVAVTTSVRIDPKTVVLSFLTAPAGLLISLNSAQLVTPFSATVIAGSSNSITAAATQTSNGTTYAFDTWSQGGAATQTFTAPAGNATYTATYHSINTTTPPAMPTGLGATVLAGPQVQLSWTDNANNETGFVFQRRYTGWIWEDLALTAAANATTAIDTTAIGNVAYEYRVAAKNTAGQSAWSDGFVVNTANVGTQPPVAPTTLTATAASATQVNLAWADNSGNETGFRIDRAIAGGTFGALTTLASNAVTYADTTVVAGTAYQYRVVALNGAVASDPSNTALVTTPGGTGVVPAAPANLTATVVGATSVALAWADKSTNETGFLIQRRYTNWIWGDVATVGANVTSFTDTAAWANATYEYRVIAISAAGNSPDSNWVQIFVPAAAPAPAMTATTTTRKKPVASILP